MPPLICWAFLLLSFNVCSGQQNNESTVIQNGTPQFLESIDRQEDIDLLIAADEEQAELPEEIRQAFSEDAQADTIKLIDVNAEQEEQKEPPRRKQANFTLQKPVEPTCLPKLDIVFLLDSSGSIQRIYQEHVRWAVALVDSLPIEPDTIRVAAVQYAGFPLTEFALGTYPSVDDIRQHLENINFRSGVSRTGYALRKAEAELFRPDRGAREDAIKVIVLFTDGTSVDDPLKPAHQLRDLKGVKIFVVSLKADAEQMNKIAGDNEHVFGPNDLKRLRDALITEAEKTRACIRIGNTRPFKGSSSINNAPFAAQGAKWLSIGQTKPDQPFRNDLKDIIELSRASAAISAARPGLLDEDKGKMTVKTTSQTGTQPSTTTPEIKQTSTTTKLTTQSSPKTQSSTIKPTTFKPFLGVRVEEMEQDAFELPTNRKGQQKTTRFQPTTISQLIRSTTPRPATSTTQQSTTKKSFKSLTEKLSSARREFTISSTQSSSTKKAFPIVQNAVPLFNPNEEKTTYVPTWRRTQTTTKATPTVTATNKFQATKSKAEPLIQLNPAFPTLKPVQKIEATTTRSTVSVTRPQLSKVHLMFPGVTCPHDILFLLDSSGSIQRSYETQKAYLRDMLSRIQVGNETHRVALLQFAGYRIQKTEWTYNSFSDNPTLMRAVENIRFLTGTTFIGAALNSARQILEQRRKGIPSLVVLLSDGYSQDDALRSAEQIRKLPNLEFYALSVSDLNNMQYLAQIVGSVQHVFRNDESEMLRALILNRLHCRF